MFIDCNSRRNTKNANIFKRAKALSLCLTVFCTSGAFAFPVFADEYKCGLEEHSHTVECYEPTSADDENAVLICDSYDEEHVHDDSCYGKLICGKTQHIHDNECLNNRIRSGGIHEVSSEEELKSAIASANTGDYISIQADIDMSGGITINKDLTILGNGHEIHFTDSGDGHRISISKGAIVNFGLSDDLLEDLPDNTNKLVFSSVKVAKDGPGFVVIDGGSTLNMYDGVTIKDYYSNNYYGGGVTLKNGIFHMYGGTIENCGVDGGSNCYGGGVAVMYGSQFIMDGGTIKNCFVKGWDSAYSNNKFYYPHTSGGGVFISLGGSFIMNDGTIENCKAFIGYGERYNDSATGGGITVAACYESYKENGLGYLDATLEINGGKITGNTADIGGGIAALGTCITNSPLAALKPNIDKNPETDGFRINGGEISNNTSETGGGIVAYYIVPVIDQETNDNIASYIKNADIKNNKSTDDVGGGICVFAGKTQLQVENCNISGNEALGGGGIGIVGNRPDGTVLKNTVITENKAIKNEDSEGYGGGIFISGNSGISFDKKCAVYNNTAEVGADDIYKDENSVINDLPTAEQMKVSTGENITGWYWDYENIDGETYEYPDGTIHDCKRYSADNAVIYEPISPETAKRYLKAVVEEVPETYTVTFKAGRHGYFDDKRDDEEIVIDGCEKDGKVGNVVPVVEPDDGYKFIGWKIDDEGELLSNEEVADYTVTGDITFVAQYEKKNSDSGYELPEKHIERPEEKPELETQEHFQYISGYPDGTVRPNANITRAEVATIFYRLLSDDSRNAYYSIVENFSDVQSTDWYLKAVATLTNAGILHGDEGADTFRPNDSITRAEFATIVSFFDDLSYTGEDRFSDIAGHWANAYINSASANGWINGYPNGTYNPDAAITRAEAMTIINNVLGREVDGEGLHWKTKMWPDNPNYAWYYYEVLEATNYHDYVREIEDEAEKWTDIRPNKVWNEGAAN